MTEASNDTKTIIVKLAKVRSKIINDFTNQKLEYTKKKSQNSNEPTANFSHLSRLMDTCS